MFCYIKSAVTVPAAIQNRRRNAVYLVGILANLLLIGGCGSAPPIPWQDISYPSLNVASTAYLGEQLLHQGRGLRTDTVRVGAVRGKFAVIENATFCQLRTGSDEFVSLDTRAIRFLNFIGGTRGYSNKVTYKQHKDELCVNDFWSGCFDSSEAQFDYRPDAICSRPNTLQQAIEYNGRSGDTLNFTYRETSGGQVAFPVTQNFTMDINEGNVVNYKGARLQVDRATNQEITYVVLKNFASY